jgi:cytochrome oxidase Cu insertion factor (SCO1/SenC/PrrC family)
MRPDATWAAGAQLAPTFRLRDETGAPLTLASLRGRPVIITFVDPICHSLCPLEARVLSDAVQSLPAGERVPIISVSVNPAQDKRSHFALDARRWRLAPSWRWAVGSYRQLAAVWRAYHIAVQTQRREVAHTEGAYIIDAKGYQRALFLYPFQAEDVARVIKDL